MSTIMALKGMAQLMIQLRSMQLSQMAGDVARRVAPVLEYLLWCIFHQERTSSAHPSFNTTILNFLEMYVKLVSYDI